MRNSVNMKRYTVLGISFILFAFTLPAISWGPKVPNKTDTLAAANIKVVASQGKQVEYSAEEKLEDYIDDVYDEMDLRGKGLKKRIFTNAIIGFHNLKKAGRVSADKQIITIIDFEKASFYKRLWVLNLKTKKTLFHSFVAHGRGSGNEYAQVFSDKENSHQSSLGFYVTSNTYIGQHGLSLKLHGMDAGFNKNAFNRAIVVHGANYVSLDFIKKHGRLGRSHGCPALPVELNEAIINVIKNKTVMYIDGDINSYSSVYLNRSMAATQFASDNNILSASL